MSLRQGEMKDFKLQAFLDVINELVRADEIERALWVCDNLPAYYRQYTPIEIIELKNKILSKLATPTVYATSRFDANVDFDDRTNTSKTLRGQIICHEVEWFNQQGVIPHIIDYGPGEYWLPFVLKKKNLKFTYQDIYLAKAAHDLAITKLEEYRAPYDGAPRIFVACEIIEHLWHEADIKTEMLANIGLADIIHISTPRYTFGQFCTDWEKDKEHLGHLRAYTPNEFVNKLVHIFPEYHYKYFDSYIMHMRLAKKGVPEEVKGLFDASVITEEKA